MTKTRLRIFTCFGDLPKELRDCIWELAIQNDKDEPEIHFFSVSDEPQRYVNDREGTRTITEWMDAYSYAKAPMWKSGRGYHKAWDSRKNPSGYLLDSGLWLACVESRDAVARRRTHVDDPYEDVLSIKMPAGKNSSWQRSIAIRPRRDLVVFQIQNVISRRLGILDHLVERTMFWNCLYPVNLGIEYDPQWGRDLHEANPDGDSTTDMDYDGLPVSHLLQELADFATTSYAHNDMWLVDHDTLRPAPGVEYAELLKDAELSEYHDVFKARGRKYIEVELGDMGKKWIVAKGFEEWQTPWAFAQQVHCHPQYDERVRVFPEWFSNSGSWRVAAYLEGE